MQDAVQQAGGLAPEADVARINLARVVQDGEMIWVPVPGEEPPEAVEATGTTHPPVPAPDAVSGTAEGSGPDTTAPVLVVDLNTADQAQLEQLPGVGPVTASAILRWRAENGRFSSAEELLEISGIGPRTLEKLRPHLTW